MTWPQRYDLPTLNEEDDSTTLLRTTSVRDAPDAPANRLTPPLQSQVPSSVPFEKPTRTGLAEVEKQLKPDTDVRSAFKLLQLMTSIRKHPLRSIATKKAAYLLVKKAALAGRQV